ncbi:MAG: hypothetical protein ACR2QQ_08995, partial [Gammaproteobacteria bacterium]
MNGKPNMDTKIPARNRWFGMASIITLSLALGACGGGGPPGGPQMPPAAVSAAEVVQRSITDWDEFTGRVEAVDHIEIRPRVAGYLDAIHFREGGVV